ncbi:hypothetical protein ACFO1B_15705 [Dactylosporangium siamense]|uniref:Uncharacterized protein n=1 Tax=Dactylosporangium siamense TaxID=685454 RepID=A0A919PI51_9ACTN|nr:hypothetical protein [Dactylosporangium siamense]GIG45285.1 hypothetical protein Dsi01nite_033260 [Dactylosporangium siamense]
MTEIPDLKVALLGTTNSGKSSYLQGMYATLAAGLMNGFFLYCRDRKLDLQLLAEWEELNTNGTFPETTREGASFEYPFVLNAGIDPWLNFDMLDYRGGALLTSDDEDPDVIRMRAQLRAAHSVYAVISCEHLTKRITPENRAQVLMSTKIAAISTHLQREIGRRRAEGAKPPSVVVLLTKADLLRPRFQGQPGDVLFKEIVEDVRLLFPLAFQKHISAMICPVRLGYFGTADARQVQAPSVAPNNLMQPIAFTLLHRLGVANAETARAVEQAQRTFTQAEQAEKSYGAKFFRTVAKEDAFAAATRAAAAKLAVLREQLAVDTSRYQDLGEQIGHLPLIQDGTVLDFASSSSSSSSSSADVQ